jgi:hypothetical protein
VRTPALSKAFIKILLPIMHRGVFCEGSPRGSSHQRISVLTYPAGKQHGRMNQKPPRANGYEKKITAPKSSPFREAARQ